MSPRARSRLTKILQLEDFDAASRQHLPKAVYEYVRDGAGDERSLRRNREIFDKLLWHPRRLRDVTRPRTGISIFGQDYLLPFGLAPTGGAAMIRYDVDCLEAAAAYSRNVPYTLSANALTLLEDVIKTNPQSWFAAYFPLDVTIIDGMLDRLTRAGYSTLLLTVDVPVGASRIAETRAG